MCLGNSAKSMEALIFEFKLDLNCSILFLLFTVKIPCIDTVVGSLYFEIFRFLHLVSWIFSLNAVSLGRFGGM